MEAVDRLSLARRTLAQAEESVGLRGPVALAGAQIRELPGGWAVPEGFEEFFPRGLAPGMSIGVRGSRIVTLMLAAVASSAGAWTAFLGCQGTGWGMARALGVDLERVVCVPRVSEGVSSQVLAAAVDGFDVVAVGPGVHVDARGRRLLVKRALTRGCLLLGEGWDVRERISGRFAGVQGTESGAGHIRAVRLEISRPAMRGKVFLVDAEGWHVAADQVRAPALTAAPRIGRPSLLRGGAEAGASAAVGAAGAGGAGAGFDGAHSEAAAPATAGLRVVRS
ncbi:MAG: hypothetical protein Q3979_04260 [Actinomycetaceae bacterium]|nr:hypothetical protein [Actinomycetaceae bacterium]